MEISWRKGATTWPIFMGKLASFREGRLQVAPHLEDHPRTCKWLMTMVSKFPKWGYSPYKWPFHGL